MRNKPRSAAEGAATWLALANAGATEAVGAVALPQVTVVATRSPRAADELPASVTIKEREALDERFVEDVRDLVRDEPGVTVRRAPSRFGLANTLSGAVRFGTLEALARATYRRSEELDNQGDNDAPNASRTRPNPQALDSTALLTRLAWRLGADNRLRVTAEGVRQALFTNALSAVAVPPLAATSTIGLTADDTIRRARFGIDQAWVVRKPTRDGLVSSLELFDAGGDLIATFFNARKPGQSERPHWRALLDGLPLEDA